MSGENVDGAARWHRRRQGPQQSEGIGEGSGKNESQPNALAAPSTPAFEPTLGGTQPPGPLADAAL